jgi:hypothetical protein
MNSFVQESYRYENRTTFTREVIEADKFKEINDKHKKAWIKTILYNSYFSYC